MDEKIEKAPEQTPKFTEPVVRQDKIWKVVALMAVCAIVFGSVGYYAGQNNPKEASQTAEATKTTDLSSIIQTKTTTASTSATADATANWKTYTNDTYGFSFKHPSNWLEYSPGGNDNNNFQIFFRNPEVNSTTEGENADPFAIQNIFVRVYDKNSSELLSDWLTSKYQSLGGELANYRVGEQILMGGLKGYVSDIGCCGSFDKSYVIEKDGNVFGLGTFSSEKYTMLAEIARTFQFTK